MSETETHLLAGRPSIAADRAAASTVVADRGAEADTPSATLPARSTPKAKGGRGTSEGPSTPSAASSGSSLLGDREE